jgi:hypothetical protein
MGCYVSAAQAARHPKPGISIGGVLPIGTALVTEFAPIASARE